MIRADEVVVGVDGTDGAAGAAEWAARQAVAWGLPLALVHGLRWPVYDQVHLHQPEGASDEESLRRWAVHLLDGLAERCRALGPVEVRTSVVPGDPADVVARGADRAAFVVTGHSGGGGVRGVLLGSVASQLVQSCSRPVVVVPEQASGAAEGPVVVGVDGSPAGGRAVRFAFEFASHVGADDVLLHATGD
ncbi:universal stress protein, partial [Actinosynnema sp. NPDC023658]|uniref:universal stress protein n=1 Tax=Actinosynnema sp. NPDC023658 TaxID=3155465 RepID=UPI0033C3B6BE